MGLLLALIPSLLFIGIVIYQLVGNLPALRQGQDIVSRLVNKRRRKASAGDRPLGTPVPDAMTVVSFSDLPSLLSAVRRYRPLLGGSYVRGSSAGYSIRIS